MLVADFDNDGWPDIYVANDSTSSALYQNNHDGTFTDIAIEAGVAYSADGKPQAGMGVSAADYDCDGHLDIVKTNFAGDTSSLYRNLGNGVFEDRPSSRDWAATRAFSAGASVFVDFDNDGWPDILLCNGHVIRRWRDAAIESGYRQRKVLVPQSGQRPVRGRVAARPAPAFWNRCRGGAARSATSTTTATWTWWSTA